jgi:four helix bundle protein
MHNLNELKIWRKAVDLAVDIYKVTAQFPPEEKYGLTSQIRRASVSISSNIAEGAGRNSEKEFKHFLGIANGSSFELQTQLFISNKLSLINDEDLENLKLCIDELQRMNYGFQKMLSKKSSIN